MIPRTMVSLGRLRSLLLVAAALALSACATMGGAGGEGDTTVEVRNNLIPPTSLSVYVIPEIGARQLVGLVQPGATRTLRYSPTSRGQVRFRAETTEGREIVSNPLTFSAGATVTWDVNANLATVTGGG